MIILALGVISIYLSHMYEEQKQRPLFIIRRPKTSELRAPATSSMPPKVIASRYDESYVTAGADRASGWRDTKIFLLYLLAAAVLHFPHYGSFVGDITPDFYLHYNWAKEFAENFALGNPYPRWTFHARLGLGEPTFIFYAPLYYYADCSGFSSGA